MLGLSPVNPLLMVLVLWLVARAGLAEPLHGWADRWEKEVGHQFGKRAGNYVPPSRQQQEEAEAGLRALLNNDEVAARTHFENLGMVLSRWHGMWLVEDVERGWGRVLVKEGAPLVVSVPHPVADFGSPEYGWRIFLKLDASVFIMAGVHRRNHNQPSEVYPQYSVSDMTHTRESVFQAFHRAALTPGTSLLQVHGFRPRSGQAHSIILSDGRDDGRDPPLLKRLHQALNQAGLATHIVDFDRDKGRLGATQNQQGPLVRRAEFVHMELDEELRTSENRADYMKALVEALVPTFSNS